MKRRQAITRKTRRGARRLARGERGSQLVELALVMPIMLLMFAATAEFGRFFYTYTTLAKATRSGARYLATAEKKGAEETAARNLVIYGNPEGTGAPIVTGLSPAQIVVSRQGTPGTSNEKVTVSVVGYRFQPLIDLGRMTGITGLSLNIDVRPSTTMRYLRTQPLL